MRGSVRSERQQTLAVGRPIDSPDLERRVVGRCHAGQRDDTCRVGVDQMILPSSTNAICSPSGDQWDRALSRRGRAATRDSCLARCRSRRCPDRSLVRTVFHRDRDGPSVRGPRDRASISICSRRHETHLSVVHGDEDDVATGRRGEVEPSGDHAGMPFGPRRDDGRRLRRSAGPTTIPGRYGGAPYRLGTNGRTWTRAALNRGTSIRRATPTGTAAPSTAVTTIAVSGLGL